jgi:hypothetical protein
VDEPKSILKQIDRLPQKLHQGTPRNGLQKPRRLRDDAVREKFEKLGIFPPELPGPPLEHFNISEQGVRVLDRTVGNGTARGRIIDVYFKPEKVLCEYCDSNSCRHVQFALSIPAVQKILDRKGWIVKEQNQS